MEDNSQLGAAGGRESVVCIHEDCPAVRQEMFGGGHLQNPRVLLLDLHERGTNHSLAPPTARAGGRSLDIGVAAAARAGGSFLGIGYTAIWNDGKNQVDAIAHNCCNVGVYCIDFFKKLKVAF